MNTATATEQEVTLYTLEDIARIWRCEHRYARDTIVKLPGFPAEAPGSGYKRRLWIASEVRAFATRRTIVSRGEVIPVPEEKGGRNAKR